MKATELRIGNLFTTFFPVGGSVYEKQRFDGDILIATKETFYYWDEANHTPIYLTKEWFQKLGSLNPNPGYELESIYNRKFIVRENKRDKSIFYYGETRLEFVHQLQNIYFALTGTELLLK